MVYRWVFWIALVQQGWQVAGDPEKQGLECLKRYSAAINALNKTPGTRVHEDLRQTLLTTWFSSPRQPVPDVWQPLRTYREEQPRISVGAWMARLPDYFWEGFSYRLDSVRLSESSARDAPVFVASVRMHGLSASTKTKLDFCENQAFTLKLKGNGCTIEDIRGLGTGFREPLTSHRLQEVHAELETLLRELASGPTRSGRRREILRLLGEWMSSDSVCCETPQKRHTLGELAALQLPAEKAAQLKVRRADMRFSGNYYLDRDGSLCADFIAFDGITSWTGPVPECESREQGSRRLPSQQRPRNPVEIRNIVLNY